MSFLSDIDINTFFTQLMQNQHIWILEVFLLVLATLFLASFVQKLLNKLELQTRESKNLWDDGLVDALKAPSHWLVWLLGISFAADLVAFSAEAPITDITTKVRAIGLIVLITWFFVSKVTT